MFNLGKSITFIFGFYFLSMSAQASGSGTETTMDWGVGKLTGEGSYAHDQNNFIEGTDLGSMFEFDGKLLFLFGDTNIVEGNPSRHLSNTMAWTEDRRSRDGLKLEMVTIQDLHPNFAHFYAKESRKQALACECNCNTYGCCDIDDGIFTNKRVHYEWALTKTDAELLTELMRKTKKILNYDSSSSRRAAYYADIASRLANLGIPFHDKYNTTASESANFARNAPFEQWHYDWAMSQHKSILRSEIENRYEKISEAIDDNLPKQIFASKIFPDEYTVIPTHGVVIDNTIYVFFMSIKTWDGSGQWTVNYASIASSTDGLTFKRHDDVIRFHKNGNFVQIAPVLQEDQLLVYGIPAGRHGEVQLARVHKDQVLEPSAYEVYTGVNAPASSLERSVRKVRTRSPFGHGAIALEALKKWKSVTAEDVTIFGSASAPALKTIVAAPVGELSIAWHPHQEHWLMSYLNVNKNRIVLRKSEDLFDWGKKRDTETVVQCRANGPHGWCYGGFIHSQLMKANSVYMVMSSWSTQEDGRWLEERYNTFLIKHDYPE